MAFDVTKHALVPKHSKLSDKETRELFERYSIDAKSLPRIHSADPALADLKAKEGDIIRIERRSPTAGVTHFYRKVVSS